MRPEEATSAQEAPEPVEDAPTRDTDLPSEAGEEGPVDGPATPISWPLAGGEFPTPGPWPDLGTEKQIRARQLGIIPRT